MTSDHQPTLRRAATQWRIPYAIPGLRYCVAALRNVGWWSAATKER